MTRIAPVRIVSKTKQTTSSKRPALKAARHDVLFLTGTDPRSLCDATHRTANGLFDLKVLNKFIDAFSTTVGIIEVSQKGGTHT